MRVEGPLPAQRPDATATVHNIGAHRYVNAVLDRLAEPYLRRPVGRPPREGYETIVELGPYQAASWQ